MNFPSPMPVAPALRSRLAAIDLARGAALVGMFVFHFVWDLGFFGFVPPEMPYSSGFMFFGHVVAASFLFLAGVSLVLASRGGFAARPFAKRMGVLAAAAALVSAATYAAFPDRFVFFGILHCILVACLVGAALERAPTWILAILALAIWAAPLFIADAMFDRPTLWWVGLGEGEPATNDWRPFFPWTGFTLAGVVAARVGLSHGWFERLGRLPTRDFASRALTFGGRHSLLIYLVHQPVFLGLIWAATFIVSPAEKNYIAACEAQCARSGADVGFCSRACGCVARRLGQENLWTPVLRNSLDGAQSEAFTAISRACSGESSR